MDEQGVNYHYLMHEKANETSPDLFGAIVIEHRVMRFPANNFFTKLFKIQDHQVILI